MLIRFLSSGIVVIVEDFEKANVHALKASKSPNKFIKIRAKDILLLTDSKK